MTHATVWISTPETHLFQPLPIGEMKAWVKEAIEKRREFSVRHYSDLWCPLGYRVIVRAWTTLEGEYKTDSDFVRG